MTALVTGLLCHSFMIFNKISWHDDVSNIFDVGATYSSGRWALGLLSSAVKALWGMNLSMPVINGVLSILFIALSAYLIILKFNLNKIYEQILTVAAMVSFPVVAATFGYIFTAPYYFFALFLATAGAYFICSYLDDVSTRYKIVYGLIGIVCIAIATGIYQAYFAFAAGYIFFYLLYALYTSEAEDKHLIQTGVLMVLTCAAALAVYVIVNKIFLAFAHVGMDDYQGLSSMTSFSLKSIFIGIAKCYYKFLLLFISGYNGLFTTVSSRIVLLVLAYAYGAACLVRMRDVKSSVRKILILVMHALTPVIIQLIVLLSANSTGSAWVHTLMVYNIVFLMIVPLCFIQTKLLKKIAVLCIALLIFSFGVLDNIAYFKAWIYTQQEMQYYNRLIMRIEEYDGYETGMPIALVGEFNTDSFVHYDELDQVTIIPYRSDFLMIQNAIFNEIVGKCRRCTL